MCEHVCGHACKAEDVYTTPDKHGLTPVGRSDTISLRDARAFV